ncbi:MAG: DUF397 domain-containing protein [Thermocrispum sp.]
MDEQQVTWRKSSYSGGNGGGCVEVALTTHAALVRDTKNRAVGTLRMSPHHWAALVAEVKTGRLDPH